jgi:hypothetical protein
MYYKLLVPWRAAVPVLDVVEVILHHMLSLRIRLHHVYQPPTPKALGRALFFKHRCVIIVLKYSVNYEYWI